MSAICPQCGYEITSKPVHKNFSLRPTYHCDHCGYTDVLPLRKSTRMFWWSIILAGLAIFLYAVMSGRGWHAGLLTLIAAYLLFKDWRVMSKVKTYRETKRLKGPIPQEKEGNWLRKGVIMSALVLGISFAFQYWVNQVALSNGYVLSTNWQTFSAGDGHFKVEMPNPPKTTKEVIPNKVLGDVSLTMYTAKTAKGASYTATFSQYKESVEATRSASMLQNEVNTFVLKVPNSQVVSSTFFQYHNHPAIDFLVHGNNTDAFYQGRVIIIDNKKYALLAASLHQVPPDFDGFVNSFSIDTSSQ